MLIMLLNSCISEVFNNNYGHRLIAYYSKCLTTILPTSHGAVLEELGLKAVCLIFCVAFNIRSYHLLQFIICGWLSYSLSFGSKQLRYTHHSPIIAYRVAYKPLSTALPLLSMWNDYLVAPQLQHTCEDVSRTWLVAAIIWLEAFWRAALLMARVSTLCR